VASPISYRRIRLAAFVGFVLLGAAWATATPYDGAPDERDHILRAYGVVTGQIFLAPEDAALGGGGFVLAPRSLDADRCWQFSPGENASCAGSPGQDETVERLATSAGRNSPFYYALVGLPVALAPNWTGVILARLISVLLCAALLANALADALRWGRYRIMAAGVLAATTPMVAHLVGSVNPSALELAASIAFFAAAVPLLLHPDGRRDSTLLGHAGIAGLALGTTRMLGPLWLALAVLVLLAPWRRATLRELWAWRRARGWALVIASATVGGGLWTLLSRGADANPYFRPEQQVSAVRVVWTELQSWSRYVDEMVGVFSWLDARMPEVGYLIWPLVGGSLVLWGYVVSDRGGRLRLASLAGVGILAPMSISVLLANTFGFITQGRYLLPLLVGLPILATYLIGRDDAISAGRAGSIVRLTVVALLPLQLLALVFTMQRWQLGQGIGAGLNLLDTPWRPPLGPVVPLVAAVAGLGLLGRLAWAGTAGRGAPGSRAPQGSEGPVATQVHQQETDLQGQRDDRVRALDRRPRHRTT